MTDAIRYALKYKPSVIILCTDGGTIPRQGRVGAMPTNHRTHQDLPTFRVSGEYEYLHPGKKDDK